MPDRDPAMAERVRRVVRHPGVLAGAEHRLISTRLRDPREHLPIGNTILGWARLVDRLHQPLGQVHPEGLVAFRRRTRKTEAEACEVDVAPAQPDGLAEAEAALLDGDEQQLPLRPDRLEDGLHMLAGGGCGSSRTRFGSLTRGSRAGFGSQPP